LSPNARLARARDLAGVAVVAAKELAAIPGEARRHRPNPPADGLVLEIGGGQAPHPRADVVVDKYVADSFERAGEARLDVSKPLVVADGHRLPFADRSAAYALAIHVLEHATDPVKFAGELARVAPAGFVQTPTAEAELTFGWPFHPWLIELSGNTLLFTPKGDRRAVYGERFHQSFAESPLMRLWWSAHRSRWHQSIEWRERLDVQVDGAGAPEQSAELDVEQTVATLESLDEQRPLVPLGDAARVALRCPLCLGVLAFEPRRTVCAECGRRYPVAGEVPILLEEAASSA
jgi:hypothetical protein